MIDLKNELSHLPPEKISELEIIINKILETGDADIVVLFGFYANKEIKKVNAKEYDILVITDHWETKEELANKLKDEFSKLSLPVNGIVETITMVNINLEQGQYFFSEIIREGIVLFNNLEFELGKPKEISKRKRIKIAKSDFEEWFGKAKESWTEYNNYFERSEKRSAAFYLNQTVEMCYTAIEMIFAHYKNEEHKLLLQRDRIRGFDKRVLNAFPLDQPIQQELLKKLDLAYTDARYKDEDQFPITKDEMNYWAIEAEKLLRLTQEIGKDKIERLELFD